jgi:hypothetical protein
MLSNIGFSTQLSKREQQQIKGGIICAPDGGGPWIKLPDDVCPAGYVEVPRPIRPRL